MAKGKQKANMKQLLQKLTDTFSPSGNEQAIRSVILKEVKDSADECRVDTLGNLIVRKGGLGRGATASAGKRIMIAAHMDEIGLMVTHVDEKGFIRFTGHWRSVPAQPARRARALCEWPVRSHRPRTDRSRLGCSRP